jgi:hypothetical protein
MYSLLYYDQSNGSISLAGEITISRNLKLKIITYLKFCACALFSKKLVPIDHVSTTVVKNLISRAYIPVHATRPQSQLGRSMQK